MDDFDPENQKQSVKDFDFFEKSKPIDLLCDASGQQLSKRLGVFKTINNTDFHFPGQKNVYKGKVREVKHKLIEFDENKIFAWSDPIILGLKDHHQFIIKPISENISKKLNKSENLKIFLKNSKKNHVFFKNLKILKLFFFTKKMCKKKKLCGKKSKIHEKKLINGVPISSTTTIDVNIAKPVLNVRYLKTLRNEYSPIELRIRL